MDGQECTLTGAVELPKGGAKKIIAPNIDQIALASIVSFS